MSDNKTSANLLNSIKPFFEKIDINEIFSLDEMISPKLITILYWLLLFLALGSGLGAIFDGDVFRGLFIMASISIGGRIVCELMIVIFRINKNLNEINDREKGFSSVSVDVNSTGDIEQPSEKSRDIDVEKSTEGEGHE